MIGLIVHSASPLSGQASVLNRNLSEASELNSGPDGVSRWNLNGTLKRPLETGKSTAFPYTNE
jgi:hypothetical protein